ncbi:MAG: biotin--[acetyl-CoA-carboxylase] ligase [Chlorobi bacterium]|nr:biotin--[acetyl-CoA-carboxylase] ligase [Chlorobiota bacterium]
MDFQIEEIESLGSTNDYLFDIIAGGDVKEGKIIIARNQLKGKGTSNNKWESEAGKNLTFSILVKPDFIMAENQFVITQIVSLALTNSLSCFLDEDKLKIKWPNDIYYSNGKLAGILIQNIIKGSTISHSVIGIGLNLNQERFYSGAPNPVSMVQIANKTFDPKDVLKKILESFEENYYRFMLFPKTKWLEKSYLDKMFRFNNLSEFTENARAFKGRIKGIDNYGRLIVIKQNGEEKFYGFKEIEFVI